MRADFLSYIPFNQALDRETAAFGRVRDGGEPEIIGFETGPVITLGVRGDDADLEWPAAEIVERGFEVVRIDRGGQATLHNPGQLVIFPVVDIRSFGARAWVDLLLEVSRVTIAGFGKESRCRAGQPGLYSDKGKIAAIGIRLRQGISTHGVSINVSNRLADFAAIRPCGVRGAPVDRLGAEYPLADVFAAWLKNFTDQLTSDSKLTSLGCS